MKHYRKLNVEIARRLGEINTMLGVPGLKLAVVVIHPTEPDASFVVTDASYAEIRTALDKCETYDAERTAGGVRIMA